MQKAGLIHTVLLGATLSYLVFLAIVDFIQMIPLAPVDDLVLTALVVFLAALSAFSVALALFLPRLMSRVVESLQSVRLAKIHFIRGAILESVAVYGLVLGLMGAGWAVVLPFFIISIGALIGTYPIGKQTTR